MPGWFDGLREKALEKAMPESDTPKPTEVYGDWENKLLGELGELRKKAVDKAMPPPAPKPEPEEPRRAPVQAVDTAEPVAADTGLVDTGFEDTGLVDTGLVDTGFVPPDYSNPTTEEIATAPDKTPLGWLANSNAEIYKGVKAFDGFSHGQLRAAAKDAAAVDYDKDMDSFGRENAETETLTNEEWGGWEIVSFPPRKAGEEGHSYFISPDGVVWRDPWVSKKEREE